MKAAVYHSLDLLPPNTALAVGTFDGVHRGHQAILTTMAAYAQATQRAPWVLSFEGKPSAFLKPECDKGAIYDADLQTAYLQTMGASLIRQPFNATFAARSAEDFLQALRNAVIFCGEDWRFGKGAVGDIAFLRERGVEVHVVPYVIEAGERISSTRIRQAITDGAMDLAATMLGRPWEFVGVVQHGRALAGKTFGVPTLNIPYKGRHGERLTPLAYGVYCGEAEVCQADGSTLVAPALMNFGVAPSIKNDPEPLFEVHLLDVSGDFYGATVTLRLTHPCLRREQRFASLEALRAQIHADLAVCRGLLKP